MATRPRLARTSRRPTVRRAVAALTAAAALAVGGVAASAPPALADTAPSDPARPATVSVDPLPTTQIDGVAWTQLVVGRTVYVGGEFTTARPAGAAPGVGQVARRNLLAYDLETGALVPGFAPAVNGPVRDLAVSPDGRTLYVVGQFTQIDGQNRYRAAAFDVATGALSSTFRPTVNSTVVAVGATATSVVIGGSFSSVNGTARTKVAALSPTGATQAFSASIPSGNVLALTIAPDGASVVVGGNFTTVNGSGNPGYGLARLAMATGASQPLPVNAVARNGGQNAAILSLESDGTAFYGTGYVYGSGGNVEGAFAASWASGELVWIEDCHGDSYSAFPAGQAVYQASHKHYCGNTDGFPQTTPWSFYRGTATTKVATRTNTQDYLGYADHRGRPAPTILDWYPDINAGTYTGKSQGPWTVSGSPDARYVLFGGEFTEVSGVPQQGLVRFAVSSVAPDAQGPRLAGASFPLVARSTAAGRVQLTWRANIDRDNARLVYRVFRASDAGAPIHEQTLTTSFWNRHAMSFRDTGLAPGSSQRYRLHAVDPFGNVARSDWVTVTVASSGAPSAYAERVLDDAPAAYWRMGEASGATLGDATGTYDATAGSGLTRGASGAIAGDPDRATTFSGASGATAASALWGNAPEAFSVEAWVRTTSTRGGKIIGFGNQATATSANADRHLYLDDAGRPRFGVVANGFFTVGGTRALNDNAWHHVVGTYAGGTMRLYVDGAQVAQRTDVPYERAWWGQWRLGGDRLSGWPDDPTSDNLAGTLDEVAVYTRALPAATVAAHHALGTAGTPPANQAPVASFTATTSGLVAQVDGRASSDPDGTVTAWAWTFGDGATATGATASRTYAAAGTYTVRLTVTDDRGATATTTRSVTVTAPPAGGEIARDAFERTVGGGWGTADVGGAWTTSGATAQVSGGRASHVLARGATVTSSLPVAATSADVGVVVGVDRVPDVGGAFVHVQARRVAAADWYGARVRLQPDGSVQLHVTRGNGTPVAGVVAPGVSVAPGDRLQVRVQVTGTAPTTLRAKVWEVGTAEPGAWQTSATDATASLQAPGGVGLAAYLYGTATNGPLTVTYDDLRAVPVA